MLLARRYLLPDLADAAAERLVGELRPADVVPLLLRAHEEAEHAAALAIGEWAVAHFDEVAAQIDSWLGASLVGAPLAVRLLGEEQLADLREQLRVAMLKERYGL
eukprot:1670318-Prymnesium_polylepis.1